MEHVKTIIFASHRKSLMKFADTVVYLDKDTGKRHTITRDMPVKVDYENGLEGTDDDATDDKAAKAREEVDAGEKGQIKSAKAGKKAGTGKPAAKAREDAKKAVEGALDPKKDEQK